MTALRALCVVVGLLAMSCGSLLQGSDARCDLRPERAQCTDWRGNRSGLWTTHQGVCATLGAAGAGGKFSADARCDSGSSLGGCKGTFGDGSTQTNWHYSSSSVTTADDVKAKCDSPSDFVAPE